MKSVPYAIVVVLAGLLVYVHTNSYAPFVLVERNHPDALRVWLLLGGDPNLSTPEEGSLLYQSTGPHGGYEVTEVLLAAGADPNKGSGRYTPLMNAASWVDLETVELLLRYGANPNLRNGRGQMAIDVIGRIVGGVGYGQGIESKIRHVLEVVTVRTRPLRTRHRRIDSCASPEGC